ncbi:Protocatechuate 3,4-dioxygenase alpha chain [Rickettsia endosymbiont of Cardiosporidium cionae]|nr:Protocatechuate 3,4-dioxygenase alpha chain [Rickettsia endosymbiont of Cardiosporidium cionae]
MDKNCIPITDAVIQVWQTNSYGIYQNDPSASESDNKRHELLFDPNFIGSGTTTSNNIGGFHFITIMPNIYEGHAPHVNVNITHPYLTHFQTKIFFSDSIGNKEDISLKKIKPELRSRLIATTYSELYGQNNQSGEGLYGKNTVYFIDIVLDQVIKYKEY